SESLGWGEEDLLAYKLRSCSCPFVRYLKEMGFRSAPSVWAPRN
ncbi:MAG: hypothetical protein QOJ40_2789, partial [Verrucomicrobiota bacterium]